MNNTYLQMITQRLLRSTLLLLTFCFALYLIGGLLLLSEWYYHEHRLSLLLFRTLSVIIPVFYSFLYYSMVCNTFDKTRNSKRDWLDKTILAVLVLFQTFLAIPGIAMLPLAAFGFM